MSFGIGEREREREKDLQERETRASVPVGLVRPDGDLYGDSTGMFGTKSPGSRRTENIGINGRASHPGERSRAEKPS